MLSVPPDSAASNRFFFFLTLHSHSAVAFRVKLLFPGHCLNVLGAEIAVVL